jgi:PAS domain S-box-containing protein
MNESCSDTRFVRFSLGSRWRDAVVLQTLLLLFSLLAGISTAQVKPVRSVLIIHQVGAYLPLSDNVDLGIRTSFDSSPYRIVFHREFLQAGMFTDSNQQFRDFIVSKYRNYQPDVIIVVGQAPLQFIAETHEKTFRGVPIVFCLPDRLLANLPDELHFTGVVGDIAAAKTLDAALRLRPGIKRVVVIGGLGDIDLERNAAIQNQLKSYESHLEISYFTGIPVPDLVQRLQNLPNDAIILLGNLGLDSAGNLYSTAESGAIVAGNANVPVFSLIDRSLNHGEVGGKVSDSIEQGKIAGGMASRILNGEKPQNIPIMKDVTTYMFDWRALQRWGFKESNLPPGSIVLNREPTLWERGQKYFVVGIAVIFLQAISILALFWQRAHKRKAEAELATSEEKFSKTFRQSPLVLAISRTGDSRFIEVNESFEQQLGWKRDEVIGRTAPDLDLWANGEQMAEFKRLIETDGSVRDLEAFIRRKNGEIRTLLVSGEALEVGGQNYTLSVAADITERKQAEEMLSTMSRRLIEAQEKERAWIARELHDDINQRIALLALQLEQGYPGPPSSGVEVPDHIRQVCQQLFDLGKDIHALSHRLHSSQLETLGIVSAARGFCRELSEQKKVEIEFSHEGIPRSLPKEISLCLFRVLQEALQNAVKYSGERHIRVELRGSSEEIQLTVSDSGVGFDQRDAIERHGLGLISMRERLHLVDGEFSIQSEASRGTTISARVPLEVKKTKTSVASAGG